MAQKRCTSDVQGLYLTSSPKPCACCKTLNPPQLLTQRLAYRTSSINVSLEDELSVKSFGKPVPIQWKAFFLSRSDLKSSVWKAWYLHLKLYILLDRMWQFLLSWAPSIFILGSIFWFLFQGLFYSILSDILLSSWPNSVNSWHVAMLLVPTHCQWSQLTRNSEESQHFWGLSS